MFGPLLEAARNPGDVSPLPDVPELLLEAVPDGLSWEHIRSLATEKQDGSDTTAVLLAIYAAFKSNKLGSRPDNDSEYGVAVRDIALHISRMMEPVCYGAIFDEDSTDYASLSRKGILGLHTIGLLCTLIPRGDQVLPTKALLSVTAFTNADDPWSSNSCADLARSLLLNYFQEVVPQEAAEPAPFSPLRLVRDAGKGEQPGMKTHATERTRFITEDVLTDFLRPLFAKSRPATVTASGRAAAFPEPPSRYSQGDGFGAGEDIAITKPWKYAQQYAVTVFQWAVETATTDLLQQYWPLYTPILLTLLDEPQPTSLKLRSLSIFRDFWRLCPEGLFSRTGLADVFEQTVFPNVLSLPDLTPEAESLALLGATYPALFDMAGVKGSDLVAARTEHETVPDKSTNEQATGDKFGLQSGGFSETQRKLLDKIFREGIMVGYHHAKEHVRIVEFFCQTLRHLVNGIGILSVKYLKDIIPMISEILVDPFGTKYPSGLLTATLLLQAVLQTCWPRVPYYCNEIIKIAMLSWLNIEDDHSFPPGTTSREELKQQIARTVEILFVIMKAAKLDISDRVRPLVAKDPQLRSLFISCDTP